jgi:hypothetical protein
MWKRLRQANQRLKFRSVQKLEIVCARHCIGREVKGLIRQMSLTSCSLLIAPGPDLHIPRARTAIGLTAAGLLDDINKLHRGDDVGCAGSFHTSRDW